MLSKIGVWTNFLLAKFGFNLSRISRSNSLEFPIEATAKDREMIQYCLNFSMTGLPRMWALLQAVKYLDAAKISGDLVECGVWRGGNLMLMNLISEGAQTERTIWGYDTFQGMSSPSEVDVDYLGKSAETEMHKSPKDENLQNIHAYASKDRVQAALRLIPNFRKIKLIEGLAEETLHLPANVPSEIALLRLDTDWYESTKTELEILFPKLARGGILIIDDYGHFAGSRKAVDEYLRGRNYYMHFVDYTCRLLIKLD